MGLKAVLEGVGEGRVRVPEGWGQGRSTFGGLLAAVGLAACERGREAPVRVVTSRLLEPVRPGELEVRVDVLREGRVQAVAAELVQAGVRAGVVEVVLGSGRASEIGVDAPASPGGDPESGMAFGHVPGVSPEFLQQLDMRWLEGSPPFSGGGDVRIGGFCRLQDGASGPAAVLALLDAWPAPVLGLRAGPFAASTVQWTAHLTGEPLPAGAWARYRAEPVWCADGFATTVAHLWSASGRLLAWSEQLVAVYA